MSGDLRTLAQAATPGPWEVSDANEGTSYNPGWMIANEAFYNPPTDDDAPWLAVELHTGIEADARFIAAADPTTVLALLDRAEAAEARYDALAQEVRLLADRGFYIPSQYEGDALVYADHVRALVPDPRPSHDERIDKVAEVLGVEIQPWQRQWLRFYLAGHELYLQKGRRGGWGVVQQVAERLSTDGD